MQLKKQTVLVVILASSLLSGCARPIESEVRAKPDMPVAVRTVAVTQEDVKRTSTQPATVHAFYEAEIRAKISGYVKEVKLDIGDLVLSGTVLAVIDVPEMQKQQETLKAHVARTVADTKRAESGVQLGKANVEAAKSKVAQAESELAKADASLAAMEAEFNRTSDLVQRRAVESRMLDEVRKKRDSEAAAKQAMQSAIAAANSEVTVAQAKLTASQADLEVARSQTLIAKKELEELEAVLSYSILSAPFDGVVTARNLDPGNLVRKENEVGNGKPLFVVSQLSKVRVHIPVPEVDAAFVNRGDSVRLTFPSFPAEEPIAASVTRMSGALDPSTRTMLVEVVIDNPDGKLIPGMFGQATINLDTKVASKMLPARAVRFDDSGQAYVYIVDDADKVTVLEVTTGVDDGSFIEIRSGLEPGQRVIDAHLKRFVDGQKVSLLNAEAS